MAWQRQRQRQSGAEQRRVSREASVRGAASESLPSDCSQLLSRFCLVPWFVARESGEAAGRACGHPCIRPIECSPLTLATHSAAGTHAPAPARAIVPSYLATGDTRVDWFERENDRRLVSSSSRAEAEEEAEAAAAVRRTSEWRLPQRRMLEASNAMHPSPATSSTHERTQRRWERECGVEWRGNRTEAEAAWGEQRANEPLQYEQYTPVAIRVIRIVASRLLQYSV